MKEKYSSGCHAKVFPVSQDQSRLFPRSDLVKKEPDTDKYWFARLFYRHKIASLLFPGKFIDVVGAQVYPHQEGIMQRTHSLFSELARVSPEHADFSVHMASNEKNGETSTGHICECVPCILHRSFHINEELRERALKTADKMIAIGIIPPLTDQSDYCLGKDGIVFFEVQDFRHQELRSHLQGLKRPNEREREALRLLDRHDQLLNSSKQFVSSAQPGPLKVRWN